MPTNKNAQLRYSILDECLSNFNIENTYNQLLHRVNLALEERGLSVKLRQLQDDMNNMESLYNVEIVGEYIIQKVDAEIDENERELKVSNRTCKSYHYTSKDMSIYKKAITSDEKTQLLEILHTLNRIKGLPNFTWAEEMLVKIDSSFNFNDNSNRIIDLEENVDLINNGLLSDLYYKILNKRVLKLDYKQEFENNLELICHPYYLKEYNNRWFLIAKCEEHSDLELSVFPLDRINNIDEINYPYAESSVDFVEYFSDFLGVSKPINGIIESVKLKMSHKEWNYINSKPIHESQKTLTDQCTDIYKMVGLNIMINYELENHLLQYGEKIEVLEPPSLRERIHNRIKLSVNNYKSKK